MLYLKIIIHLSLMLLLYLIWYTNWKRKGYQDWYMQCINNVYKLVGIKKEETEKINSKNEKQDYIKEVGKKMKSNKTWKM